MNVNVNPYPYWFGYPWWYPISYTYYDPWYWWYPRRIWGHCGYSYGPRVVFYGGGPYWRPFYPSFHFTSWYFSFGHHHSHYPYLSSRFYDYYDRPDLLWGVDPMDDQQVAGLIMGALGELASFVAITWLFFRYLEREEQAAPAPPRRPADAGPTT